QMLTGGKPFVEDEQHSVMHKIRLLRHQSCRKLNPEIPRELERIVDRCLEKQPRDRWRSAQDVVIALERLLAKHVDMNHHARLVLFMRGQNLITQLEADEYIRPAMIEGGGVAAMPQRQAHEAARRGALAHAIMGGVLALMMALIHVAPLGAATAPPATTTTAAEPVGHGLVRVVVTPWAEVAIDGVDLGTSTRATPFEVAAGAHELVLTHPWYEPLRRTVEVPVAAGDEPLRLTIDLASEGTLRPGLAIPVDEAVEVPLGEVAAPAPTPPVDGAAITLEPTPTPAPAPAPTVRRPARRTPARTPARPQARPTRPRPR
ncbi:MAG: PEGA domain-containing protein, partial [Kofleriaceae bacterium]